MDITQLTGTSRSRVDSSAMNTKLINKGKSCQPDGIRAKTLQDPKMPSSLIKRYSVATPTASCVEKIRKKKNPRTHLKKVKEYTETMDDYFFATRLQILSPYL